ncbi:unnamed protein product [Meloidogyne enterolobii]|uniref:Uncharacterized protein n=1 Tax=Meloidogyne enterolobii TaxID=390850 RepID=A0ACB0XY98_MELEN
MLFVPLIHGHHSLYHALLPQKSDNIFYSPSQNFSRLRYQFLPKFHLLPLTHKTTLYHSLVF